MVDKPSGLIQGTLDMLILKTQALGVSASMQVRCLSPFSDCNERG